jgi:hypothetical protein
MADPELEPEDDDIPGDEPEDEPEGDEPDDEPEGAEDDPEPEPEPDPEPEPQRQSKANARIRAQQAELKRMRDETAALRQQVEASNRQSSVAQQAELQRRQQEQLAAMEPEERARFLADQRVQGLERQVREQGWALQEATDKTDWSARTATDPVAKRYAERVDARLAEMRRNGQTAPRASVYYYLLGEDMATKGIKAIPGARAAGKARVSAARGEPPRGRGDASNTRRNSDPDSIEALEARLAKAVF